MEEKNCISCKKKVANDTGDAGFNCPNCGEFEIVRCSTCRSNATKYICPNCGFEGPN